MPRTILTTLTAYDYRDLQQRYSEKNIINQTNGQEYIIGTASKTNLTDVHGRSTSFSVANVTSWTIADYNASEGDWYNNAGQRYHWYLREEWIRTSGSFVIETDQIIVDKNSISINYQLKYDDYLDEHAEPFYASTYDSNYAEYVGIRYPNWKQNTNYLIADEELPYEHSTAETHRNWWEFWAGADTLTASSKFPTNSISYNVTKLSNNNYSITCNYSIVTWWGFNYIKGTPAGLRESRERVFDTREIEFTVTANTVEAKEVEFNYARPVALLGGAQGKNYEIASNEFLQTDEDTSPSQRQSAAVSSEIFDKFDTDRTLVSFVLLNCEKYVVDNETRYLRAEDLIYIKDENGEYLMDDDVATGNQTPSVFEVIKTRPIWNGSFEMEVTCRKVDMTI